MIQIDPKIFPKMTGAYLVGGSIRDLLCGRFPVDYDVVVIGDPWPFAQQIRAHTNGSLVEIGKPGQKIIRVVGKSVTIDIAETIDRSIEKDLMARDFTINAMAYDLSSQQLIDPMGAQRDLANRIIRMVSKDVFKRDSIRLLRAYRIAAQFGFDIEPQTRVAIEDHADLICQSAGERIRNEFFKMLQTSESHPYLCQMAASKLLFAVVPELAGLVEYRQNKHHQFNVFEHTMQAYIHLEKMLAPDPKSATVEGVQLAKNISPAQAPLIKFSMLLHDIGKPSTQTIGRNGTLHFYKHERKGSQLAESICRRLKCSNRIADTIQFLVSHHGRPRQLYTALQGQSATPRAVTRFFIACGALLPELLVMSAADALGKKQNHNRPTTEYLDFLGQLMQDYKNDFKTRAAEPPLITGHDLIADFGLEPSEQFRIILDRVEEERLSKSDMTRQEAVKLVQKIINTEDR